MLTSSRIRTESAFPTAQAYANTFCDYTGNTAAAGAPVWGVYQTDSDTNYGAPVTTAGIEVVLIASGQTVTVGGQVEVAAGGYATPHVVGTSTGTPAGRVLATDGTFCQVQIATGN